MQISANYILTKTNCLEIRKKLCLETLLNLCQRISRNPFRCWCENLGICGGVKMQNLRSWRGFVTFSILRRGRHVSRTARWVKGCGCGQSKVSTTDCCYHFKNTFSWYLISICITQSKAAVAIAKILNHRDCTVCRLIHFVFCFDDCMQEINFAHIISTYTQAEVEIFHCPRWIGKGRCLAKWPFYITLFRPSAQWFASIRIIDAAVLLVRAI